MNINEYPIIERILEQTCIRTEPFGHTVKSIILNVGIDKSGIKWSWETESWADDNGLTRSRDRQYTFTRTP